MRHFSSRASTNLGVLNATALLSSTGPTGVFTGSDEVWVNITGVFVGTITFQGSLDGVNWFTLGVTDAALGSAVSSATAVGAFVVKSDPPYVRAIMSAYTSGTAVITSTDVMLEY